MFSHNLLSPARAPALALAAWLLATAATLHAESNRPTLYLACPQECYEDYLRQELSYFDIVRDRHHADWTLLIVVQSAANGGDRVTLRVIPRVSPPKPHPTGDANPATAPRHDSLAERSAPEPEIVREVSMAPGATDDQQRRRLVDAALGALYIALLPTEHARSFRLSLPRRDGKTLSQLNDPWDYWTITPSLAVTAETGSQAYRAEAETMLLVRRVTQHNKLLLEATYTHRWSRAVLEDGSDVRAGVAAWHGVSLFAHSLGEHFALGATVTGDRDEFENVKAHVHGAPVIEYNFFPYSENVSAQLRAAYQVGPWASWYDEVSVFDRRKELRPYHALTLISDVNQDWGSIQLGVQLNSFIDRPEQLRLSGRLLLSLQLFEGFALNLDALVSWVRDQIDLRRRAVTDVELVLGSTQLPSSFNTELELGFSYTFGSVHNTIVNPRFGRLDLRDE